MRGVQEAWVGLDLGTQSVRALVVTPDGRVAGRGSRPLRSRRDGERHEQDPATWWPALAAASRAALRSAGRVHVRSVAVCATSGTVLLTDADGAPLTPGLMYDDGRAASDAEAVNALGPPVPVGVEWGLPKLAWMLREWPQLVEGAKLAHQSDVVTRALIGEAVATDSSHGLKSGFDLAGWTWPHELFDALGIATGLIPDVVPPGAVLGTVCRTAEGECGIPAGTPVLAGMTDGCAAQLAAGAVQPGDWNSVLGSTLVLKGCTEGPVDDPSGVVYCHRGPDGAWLPGGASSAGAAVFAERFPGRDLDDLSAQAAEHAYTDVLAYPLVAPGERFPFATPDAEPFVLGTPSGDAELAAALLHGLAYVERLCFDRVDLIGAPLHGALTFTGAAARNSRWCQIRADVLDRDVRLVGEAESAFGMAVLCAGADRGLDEAVAAMVRPAGTVEPRSPDHDEPYLRFVSELESRGWLDAALAAHARDRATPAHAGEAEAEDVQAG